MPKYYSFYFTLIFGCIEFTSSNYHYLPLYISMKFFIPSNLVVFEYRLKNTTIVILQICLY